jgi:hypothetical protein
MFLALCIIAFAVIGVGLGVWHRNLMIELHASNPDVWQRLGRQDITGRFWPLSLRWPIWSWGSILLRCQEIRKARRFYVLRARSTIPSGLLGLVDWTLRYSNPHLCLSSCSEP